MKEYNLLTQKLLAEGYTADNHPDYVMIGAHPFNKNDPLDNFYGGFQYYYWHIAEWVYKTPCGMQCLGKNTITGMSWLGMDYTHENDRPFIICPKHEVNCQERDEPFRSKGDGVLCKHCSLHLVNEEYEYEGSCEATRHLYDDCIRREKTSFILNKKGHVCENHMRYDDAKKEWIFNYDPMTCAEGYCRAQTSDFKDGGWCPVLNRYLSKDKGNVYFDVKYSGRDYSKDGTLFEGERFESVVKGRQLFDKPIRLDIARVIANLCQDNIRQKARWNTKDYDPLTFFRAERGEIDFHWECINIRATKKYVRDLEQDLEDIANGITVTHEYDEKKKKQQQKKDNRALAKQKRIEQIEKLILKKGYDNLEYIEQNRACKLLDVERIDELDAMHHEEKAKIKPVQMNLTDYLATQDN